MNCDNASLLLYAVTDRSWLHGQTLYEQAEQALQGGATFLQLREKELDEAHFQEEAIALKALCKQYGVPFVLDDNVALAVATDADGVHVGQSDIPVAEEARLTAHLCGNTVRVHYDCGVAGIHRLFAHKADIEAARVIIVVAGMEGALASVVGGLVDKPVIAVPTSIGYGANFHGLSALLAMLNSCAAGVSVVNIDNGFGAGRLADTMNRLR
ncbi:nickel pincer cofactor biosynthesis protein LarB [Megasphaera sp.]|uniref:nickel pincer cofactor biosynthesis protein LarB n=1 Tax=Megasphaera sp. TaxID=2023260 RepID=UPI0025C02AAC|nr:nickel pincer cofactor biosynthesis protein LarB [Megasphaera sp.]